MNTSRLRQARRLFDRPDISRKTVRHNIRAWTRSVRMLGTAWLLHNYTGAQR